MLDEETFSRARERRALSPPGGVAPAARVGPGVPPAPARVGGGVAWSVLSVPGILRGWQSGSCSLGADLGAHRAPPCWILERTAAEAQPGDWGGKAKTVFRQRPGSYCGVMGWWGDGVAGCCLRPRQCNLGAAVRTRFPARPSVLTPHPFFLPCFSGAEEIGGSGPTPSSGLPRPSSSQLGDSPSPRNRARPSPRLGRRLPKVNFWGRLEFRQAVKLNSRTRKRFNKEGL